MIVDRIIYEGIFSSFYQTAFPTFMTQDGIGKKYHSSRPVLVNKERFSSLRIMYHFPTLGVGIECERLSKIELELVDYAFHIIDLILAFLNASSKKKLENIKDEYNKKYMYLFLFYLNDRRTFFRIG